MLLKKIELEKRALESEGQINNLKKYCIDHGFYIMS